ncbi:putative RWD, RING finger and WD repeat protein C11E3,05 [Rhizoctonia solani 123E]|uniref:Putative RWD, RING finger and WD repeat protein C11E3,05 n=1 Tax=Rhizoctonia solani 123E TaxID=1423351 RepID=A0A074SC09_9AGAM|nr:putative RWD, RING finger and WD repeat protein C11E3,05 [Rhizoctonia solani 123E]
MENFVETPTPTRQLKGLLAVPPHPAVGPRPKSIPQRLNMYNTRRPSISSPLAFSQVQAESPRTPINGNGGLWEGRPGEQAAESTFYKRLRIDVSEPVGNMSISPANRDVCLAARKGLFIIDLENPYETPRFIPQGGTWEVADVQWNPHPARSNLICSTSSQKLLVWDLNMPGQNAIMRRLHAHYRAITDINWHSFTPDVLSSCGIGEFLWRGRFSTANKLFCFRFVDLDLGLATQVKWNRQDPHLLASAHDTSLLIWDDRHGSVPLATIRAHDSRIYGIDWSRKERNSIISCSLDRTIKMWNANWSPEETSSSGVSKLTPQGEIDASYPVWRARNLPFGDGVLALPQRGTFALEMFAWDEPSDNQTTPLGVRLATSFEGHRDVVKEYVWRAAGGLNATCDDREFQLVTWSKDNTLRLWPVDQQLMQDCGHIPGSPIKALMPRRGAVNETYRVVPASIPPTPATPSLTAPFTHRSVLSNVKTTQLGHLPHRHQEHKKKIPGFMTRGARANGMNPIDWMSSVKVEREIDSGQNSMLGSRATSVERTGQVVELARRRSDRSLSRSMEFEAEGEGDAEDLADEIASVNKALGNKVKFVKTDISKKRMCTVTLNGPWGETQPVFIRITFHFPPDYPRSFSRSAAPTIDLEKNPEIALKDRAYILRNLRKIRLHTRPCLDACLRFLLGFPDLHGRTFGARGADTDSDSEGEQRQSRSGIVSHLSNHADNVPMPRRCQGVFGPNGELVCFFPAAPVVIRDGRTPSPSTTSRTGTGTGSAGRVRPFAPSAIVSHALRGLSQLAVDKPTLSTSHPRARDAALRFSDHLFARASVSRPKHSDSMNSWNSSSKPAQVAPTHTFVVIKNLSSLIPADRTLAEKYVVLAKNPAAMCRTNAAVAQEHSRHDHERIWKMLATALQQVVPLYHGLQGDAKNAALRMFDEKKRVSIEGAYKSVQWGYNPLARKVVKQIYADVAQQKDAQLLAMVSIVLLSADIAAGPRVRPLRRDLNSLGVGSAPVRISIDYFSLRKRVPRQTPTDSPTWPKSASVANISPASQSLSSSGNSKNSWQSYLNNRFRLGSMPDIQAAVNAASRADSPGSSRAGSAGMRLLNVVASIPVPGGGRLTSQPLQPPPAIANDAVRRRQSVMSTATLDSTTSGRAPSEMSSGRLSVHFNHTPHRRPSMVARVPVTKPVYSSKPVAVGYRPTEHDEEDLPTMVPFVESDMVTQHHTHIIAYAELLAQWGLHHKSTEVRKSIPNLQNSKIEAALESRDVGKILSVERSCITCASTSDGQKPFGTCSYDHNWSSSMKCTVCRLPARGLTKPCLLCMHVTHLACWKRVYTHVKSCPSGCGCSCSLAQPGFDVDSKDAPSDELTSPPLQSGSGEPSQVTSPEVITKEGLRPSWI